MLTTAFLIAGVFSFLVAAIVAVWRLVIQGRSVGDLPAWEPLLGIVNALLAMIFFSLGIYRSIQSPAGGAASEPTPQVVATAPATPQAGPTVIIIPFFPTPPASEASPAPPPAGTPVPTSTPVEPGVEVTRPGDGAAVVLTGLVEGTSQGVPPGQAPRSEPPWLYLMIRRTDGEGPQWWVQAHPVVQPNGDWNGFLGEGLSDLAAETPFDICAIVSNDRLLTGRHEETPRAFARDCVSVQAAGAGEAASS